MLDLFPNNRIKENLQKIHTLKPGAKQDDQLKFIRDVEFSVSKSLTKPVINEGFFLNIIKFILIKQIYIINTKTKYIYIYI
jgi:hypothetical protein